MSFRDRSETQHSSSEEYGSDSSSEFEIEEERDSSIIDRFWKRSPSPEENFDDAEGGDEDGKWSVDIIGEEVDDQNEVRYEARWPSWKREDGTNTTWDNDLVDPHDLVSWKRSQTAKRKQLANSSLSIELWSTADVQNIRTRLRAQAVNEKMAKIESLKLEMKLESETEAKRKLDEEYWAEVAELEESQQMEAGPSSRPAKRLRSTSPEVELPVASSSRRSVTIGRSPSIMSLSGPPREGRSASVVSRAGPSVSNRYLTPPSSTASTSSISKGKGKQVVPELPPRPYRPITPSRSPSARPHRPLPSRTRIASKKSRQTQLSREWTLIAKEDDAATITIVNDEDEEEIPPLPDGFRYIESGYEYSRDVENYTQEAALYVHCDCDHCEDANYCDCQDPSDLTIDDSRVFAYENGRFAFNVPNGVEVIECNQYCQCDPHKCPNRVAQRPRDFPVEIFKTKNRGWGVRSPYDLPQGKVLGTYAGFLVKRDTPLQSAYCFDLDGNEDLDQEVEGNAYSVDSFTTGNWTRFVNHSCTPNLSVYSVVYDTIPGTNQPYHAYYALEDIPAGTEFTLDYDPKAAELIQAQTRSKKKGKSKIVKPKDARECLCGSVACRGWVRV